MLKLEECKAVFACFGLVGVLLFALPTLTVFLHFPSGERFSELWILGPNHMAGDYPFNVKEGEVYRVYLGVANHMGGLEYYRVYVKFRNQTEPLPDSINGKPSPLNQIFEYGIFLRDGEVWEKEILFSFNSFSFEGNLCRISNLIVDGCVLNVDKCVVWDEDYNGFYFQLFFELWIYNATLLDFQYHNRFVGLWLNMTLPT
ncbi:MAG: DUF1616 domain-containing protein [Candidatus Bathyarchaeia archaeon]